MSARLALLSVSDKRGLVDFARGLVEAGFELLSTGGTAAALAAAGLPYTPVSTHTGSPEIMDGRVKTLHPRIHGGLLGRRGIDDAVAAELAGRLAARAPNSIRKTKRLMRDAEHLWALMQREGEA